MKNILVTGANKGVGLEIVKELAEMGHHVFLTARDLEKGGDRYKGITGKGS